MSHMQKMTTMELFVVAETNSGKTCFPAEFIGVSDERDLSDDELRLCDQYAESKVTEAEAVLGWFARMSAPGYMDSTEWCGPFDSEEKAIDHLEAMYEDD